VAPCKSAPGVPPHITRRIVTRCPRPPITACRVAHPSRILRTVGQRCGLRIRFLALNGCRCPISRTFFAQEVESVREVGRWGRCRTISMLSFFVIPFSALSS
jgi:hypothetical protein